MSVFFLRPVTHADAEALGRLVQHAVFGLTSLPLTAAQRLKKIESSWRTFLDPNTPNGVYWFVLVAYPENTIVGCAMIMPKVGESTPLVSFHREMVVSQWRHNTPLELLHLCRWQHHPTELGGLFLDPRYRHSGVGRLLSLGRLLYMGMVPHCFDVTVIAQLRGMISPEGKSPFWDAVGGVSSGLSFSEADRLMRGGKQFLFDRLSPVPVCMHLLPSDAQACVGCVHPDTQGAAQLLRQEGFVDTRHVDIGDGGPIFMADRDQIRVVKDSRHGQVLRIYTDAPEDGVMCLVAAQTEFGIRIVATQISSFVDHGVGLSRSVADALGIQLGQEIWLVPIKSHTFLRRFSEWFTTLAAGQADRPSLVQAMPGIRVAQ